MSQDKIDAFEDDFDDWLITTEAKSKSNKGENRTYQGLLYGGFKLTKVVRIEKKGYENSISGKVSVSIERLFRPSYRRIQIIRLDLSSFLTRQYNIK